MKQIQLFRSSQLLILWFFTTPLKIVHVSGPPTSNIVKLNCDGAFKLNQGVVGIAARNCEGSLLLCVGERWHASSAIATELIALRSACSLALMRRWHNAIIESDSQLAISLASSELDPPWSLDAIVGDIKNWASHTSIQKTAFVRKYQNSSCITNNSYSIKKRTIRHRLHQLINTQRL